MADFATPLSFAIHSSGHLLCRLRENYMFTAEMGVAENEPNKFTGIAARGAFTESHVANQREAFDSAKQKQDELVLLYFSPKDTAERKLDAKAIVEKHQSVLDEMRRGCNSLLAIYTELLAHAEEHPNPAFDIENIKERAEQVNMALANLDTIGQKNK